MSALTLKNLPDSLLDHLRHRAALERRSMNGEVVHLLTAALADERVGIEPAARAREQAAAWRRLAGRWESESSAADEAAALRRARTPGRKVAGDPARHGCLHRDSAGQRCRNRLPRSDAGRIGSVSAPGAPPI